MSKQQKGRNKDANKKLATLQEETKTFVSKNVNSQNQPIKAPSKKSEKIKQNNLSAQITERTIQKQKSILRQFPEPDQYNVLKMSGILDAYQHFLKLLCKHGLPTGRVYEYAAQEIQKYERRKINKELKMRAELDIQKIKKSKPEASPEKPFHPSPSPYLER